MTFFGIDIGQIIELGTQVATTGAMRIAEVVGDDTFEYIVSIAIITYEMDPG